MTRQLKPLRQAFGVTGPRARDPYSEAARFSRTELRRVLVPAGVLYLTVNCRTRWGFLVHRALSRLRVDAGHPHTFTPRRAQALIGRSGFAIRSLEVGSYTEALWADLRSPETRSRIKGLLGVSEFLASAIALRTCA